MICTTHFVNPAVVPPVGRVIVAVEPGPHLQVSVGVHQVAVVPEHLLVLIVVVRLHCSNINSIFLQSSPRTRRAEDQ